jgi:hypothetical protein
VPRLRICGALPPSLLSFLGLMFNRPGKLENNPEDLRLYREDGVDGGCVGGMEENKLL